MGPQWPWSRLAHSVPSRGSDAAKHTFTLEKFEEFKGKPCAVIKETIKKDLNELETSEVTHRYALGIGEIERSEVVFTTPKDQKKVSEARLVDAEDSTDKK